MTYGRVRRDPTPLLDAIWNMERRRTRPASWRSPAPSRSSAWHHHDPAPADRQVCARHRLERRAGLRHRRGPGSERLQIALHGLEGEADGRIHGARRCSERHGVDVAYVRSDLAREQGAVELMRAAQNALGAVDILVNNAVVRHFAPIDRFPVEEWDRPWR